MAYEGAIYGYERSHVWSEYETRLEGSRASLVLVLHTDQPQRIARNALEKSFLALGYPADSIAYAQIKGLDPEQLFSLVEGLDPLCIVAIDEESARAYGACCRRTFAIEQKVRVFGRDARAFRSLDTLLESDAGKQQAWRLLKSLPLG